MKQREDGWVPLYKEWEVNVVVDDRDLNVLYQVDVNPYFVLLDRHKLHEDEALSVAVVLNLSFNKKKSGAQTNKVQIHKK